MNNVDRPLPSEPMFNPDAWLEIGTIVAPQGLYGEMRVYPNTDFPERFLDPGERWLVQSGSQTIEPIQLLNGRFIESKGLYVIQIDGITHRDQVEALRNSRLFVPLGDRPTLDEGEFHVADLIGLSVYHQATGECIGRVKDVLTAGNDLLEVEPITPPSSPTLQSSESLERDPSSDADPEEKQLNPTNSSKGSKKRSKSNNRRASKPPLKTFLIPFVYAIVPVVDLENQRIEILPPPGLMEDR